MSFETDGSNVSQPMDMPAFLEAQDEQHFVWDDANRELSELWMDPVRDAGLDPTKHKVFRHGDKEYLTPPAPFIRHGPDLGDSGPTVVYRVRPPEAVGYTRTLALKVIVCKEERVHPGPDSKARKLALTEVRNMSRIRHPHIVVYVASFEDYCIQAEQSRRHMRGGVKLLRRQQIKKHILAIAMYPAADHNLHTFMNELIDFPAQDAWKVKYMYTYFGCLAQAVTYLHKSTVQIRHKDIKPENIVIDEFGKPLLTDFGLAKHFETGKHSEGPTLKTIKYADPEATHETQRDVRSDIFSLGSVYLEMVTVILGKKPFFAEENLRDDTVGVFKYADCPEKLDDYFRLLRSIAEELVVKQPEKEQSVTALVDIFPHIASMMDTDHAKRPYANDLFPRFRPLYDVFEEPGLCEHCERESLFNSGSSSPTTIKTNRSSTMSSIKRTATMNSTNGGVRRSSTLGSAPRRSSTLGTHSQTQHSPTDVQMVGT